jgi:GT2 family glycosyltransferase
MRARLAPYGTWRRLLLDLAAGGLRVIVIEGWRPFVHRLVRMRYWAPLLLEERSQLPRGGSLNAQYRSWVQRRALTEERLRSMREHAAGFGYRPKVSIVMPLLRDREPAWVTRAVDSVREQVYDRWELCVATSDRTPPALREMLAPWGREDPRIRVAHIDGETDLAAVANAALGLATGDFVGLLDDLDELKPNALFEVVSLLQERRDLDIIYTDEDRRSPEGWLVDPFFKPDWSSDLLLSINYVGRLSVFRREVMDRVGGFRSGVEGSEDYDLILRATEVTDSIGHAPEPVYTRRRSPTAVGSLDGRHSDRAAGSAISDALARRGATGEVVVGLVRGSSRVRYRLDGEPSVAVIIPIRDRVDLLHRCVESIERRSSYRNHEVVVVDNGSREPETLEYLASLRGRVLRYPHKFNFSKIVNFAVSQVRTDFALFLNNDTEIIAADWIEAMLEHGQRPEVAAVGARLLYPSGKPQHEGVVVGVGGGFAANVACGDYFGLGQVIRNVSAVTAACMLTRAEVFRELGGFEERLRVAFSDVDFCLRAREKGYLIVYTPYALLYHHEGATRGKVHPLQDDRFFRERWGGYQDPYYSPKLDPNRLYELKR